MKRQSAWIAALFGALLALCGIYQTAWGRTVDEPTVVRTYYIGEGGPVQLPSGETDRVAKGNTFVIRLTQPGAVSEVHGAWVTLPRGENFSGSIFEITGTFDRNTGILSAKWEAPPALQPNPNSGHVQGIYNAAQNTFSLEFSASNEDPTGPDRKLFLLDNVGEYRGTLPFVVGIWRWSAGATLEAARSSSPPFSGEFYIVSQSLTSNGFKGLFSRSNPQDVGAIDGSVSSSNQVQFLRFGDTPDGQAFEQVWWGQVGGDGTIQNGAIQQNFPGSWSGGWIARPY